MMMNEQKYSRCKNLAPTSWMLATSAFMAFAAPAMAQSPDQGQASVAEQVPKVAPQAASVTDDIIVTATRQSSGAQRVPIALTAIGSDQLVKAGITSAGQLSQLAPSMFVQEGLGAGTPRFSLRGVTSSDTAPAGSAAVATYIDDVYQASQYSIGMQLFDVQRIEILRGPQGTTFGKNTTAGAAAYFSQVPTNEIGGYVTARVAAGDRSERFVESAINVPIVDDKLAMRFSMRVDSQGNWLEDVGQNRGYGSGQSQAGRFQLRWTPSSDTSVNATVFGTRRRGDPAFYQGDLADPCASFAASFFCPNGVATPAPRANPNTLALTPLNYYENFNNAGATVRVEQNLGLFNLTAISHYRKSDMQVSTDLDGLPGDFFEYYQQFDNEQYGQEFRLASDPTRRLSGLVGLYYQYDSVYFGNAIGTTLNGPGVDYLLRYDDLIRTRTFAAFANLTFKVTDKLSVTGGLRKSIERRRHTGQTLHFLPNPNGYDWEQRDMLYKGAPPVAPDYTIPINERQNSSPWTWDISGNYRPNGQVMIFGRVAKGFRSGGFNSITSVFSTSSPPPFQGEKLQSYELGFKSDLFGRALRLNGSVYHYDYTDQQVSAAVAGIYTTANAGTSKVDGGELEIVATPVRDLELRGSVGYANARFTNYNDGVGGVFDGNNLLYAPKWTANGTIAYTAPVTSALNLRGSTNWSYRSAIFFDAANTRAIRGAPLTLGNARLALEPVENKGFTIAAFVNNMTNRKYLAYGFQFGPDFSEKTFIPGRIYGIDVSFKW